MISETDSASYNDRERKQRESKRKCLSSSRQTRHYNKRDRREQKVQGIRERNGDTVGVWGYNVIKSSPDVESRKLSGYGLRPMLKHSVAHCAYDGEGSVELGSRDEVR